MDLGLGSIGEMKKNKSRDDRMEKFLDKNIEEQMNSERLKRIKQDKMTDEEAGDKVEYGIRYERIDKQAG